MSQNYKELGKPYSSGEYAQGISLVNDLVDSLQKKGLLPKRFDKPQTPQAAAESLRNALPAVIKEYKASPYKRELVTNYWRTKLLTDGQRVGLTIDVPDCDWSEAEIGRPMIDKEGRQVPARLVYHPAELTGREGLIRLGQMYPQMQSYTVSRDTTVTNTHETTGWLKVEATQNGDAPNLDSNQRQLEDLAKKTNYLGMRLSAYILASQQNKDLTGHYLDENTWSRLLGSRDEGRVIGADFDSDGHLDVSWFLSPKHRHPHLGGRFEEVSEASLQVKRA